MGAAVFIIIAVVISLTQVSCLKSSAQSNPVGTAANQNQILIAQDTALFITDYNGTINSINLASVSLTKSLYSNVIKPYYIVSAKFSPDGKMIFVHTRAYSQTNNPPDVIYSMDNNGNNVKKIFTSSQAFGAFVLTNSIDVR